MAGFREGQTATGPNGQKIVYQGGQWVPVGGARGVIITDPKQPYDVARARAEAETAGATAPHAGPKAAAEAETATAKARTAAIEADEAAAAQQRRIREQGTAADAQAEVLRVVRNAIEARRLSRKGWFTTGGSRAAGAGSVAERVSGSAAADLRATLDTIQGNVAFQRLQQMRQESPTGGAVGSVTERELALLSSTIASLDPNQSDERFQRSMQDVIEAYGRVYRNLGGDPNALAQVVSSDPLYVDNGGPTREMKELVGPGILPSSWSGMTPSGGSAPAIAPPSDGPRPFSNDADKAFASEAQQAFNRGASRAELDDLARRFGRDRFGLDLDKAIQLRDKGGYGATFGVPQSGSREATGIERISGNVADTPVGAFITGTGNAVTQGTLDEAGNLLSPGGMDAQVAKDLIAERHPVAYALGDLTGTGLSLFSAGRAAGAMPGFIGTASRFGGGLLPDVVLGGIRGAGEANDDRVGGALTGSLLAGGGGLVGNYAAAPIVGGTVRAADRGARNLLNLAPPPAAPTSAERSIIAALSRTDMPNVEATLQDAASRRVAMSLANASPEVEALTGAALRLSPRAAGTARATMAETSRGQYDRFVDSVGRELGPVENIPQRSADLIEQARTRAGPLYDAAYAAPGASVMGETLGPILQRPSMQRAMQGAVRIAREEGRDPMSLGFVFDDAGNPTAINSPSWQTLDYMKRGLDDVLETYRDRTTGRLVLDDEGRAIDQTRRDLLRTIDQTNPGYAAARAAYAGPASEREFLARGQRAVSANPNELGVNVSNLTPEQLEQVRLGFRAGMVDQAGRLRYSTNPFESVLGTPAMEQRLTALYGDDPVVAALMRTRDLERDVATSTNRLVGNSATAERLAADRAFEGSGASQFAIDVASNIALGQVPVGAIRHGATGAMRDAWTLGLGNRAVRRAEEIVPLTTVPDPAYSLQIARNLMGRDDAYRSYLDATTPRDPIAAAIAAALAGPAAASASAP